MPDCLLPPRRPNPAEWPAPHAAALALSEQLVRHIQAELARAGGLIPFDRFMEMALYAPGLGYYVAGSRKFGEAGDFITAPEISPLFAQCFARQAAEVLGASGGGEILEFGAGSGLFAADMLSELQRLDHLPTRYRIMEVSPELRQRQRDTLTHQCPQLLSKVVWLERLPEVFTGLVVANELLDAMPVSRFRIGDRGVEQSFVVQDPQGGFKEVFEASRNPRLEAAVKAIEHTTGALAPGYVSEINLRQAAWLQTLGERVRRGALLLIDYGHARREYYHPQRHMGTLMCHYRHRAHADPFRWIGLQDITAHVDFSAVAQAGFEAGFSLAGYTTQAHFLLGSGLEALIAASDPQDPTRHMALAQGVKRLTLPAEMGERFKVLGLVKGMPASLSGFTLRDLRSRL